ncbi:helix-turn-helix domain-containing protein [Aeromicrobium sp. Leaf350]|uniref:helix-turn-helix domain-containing protein n=1 Tax=Aeromicrobium sp. Leaf350 TaxID=2876565 RepID=UPI001E3D3147|nr:helix-turn-helix domain-containing protein [Aeromicrobium sp. Leaf350]
MTGHDARARIRAQVLEHLGEVTDRVVAAIQLEIPTYATLSREQVAEVTEIASWGTTRILDLWVDGAELTTEDLRRFKGIGAARALDGRPLPAVLRAYRLAGAEVTAMVERVGPDLLTVADTMAMARLWMASMDALSEAIYEGYHAASERVSVDRVRAIGDLAGDLLVGRQVTRTNLADRARELGVEIAPRLVLTVLRAAAADEVALAMLGDAADTSIVRVHGSSAVLVTPPQVVLLTNAAGTGRGFRSTGLRVDDLPATSRLAEHLLDHAPSSAFSRPGTLLDEGDAHALGLVRRHPDADPSRLADLVLGPLAGGDHAHVAEGLAAFLRVGSAAGAAADLGLHAQTLRQRLKRLTALTGRDPHRPWDRFVLECAVLGDERGTVTT